MGGMIAVLIVIAGLSLIYTRISDLTTCCKWLVAYIYIYLDKRRKKSRFDLYDISADGDPEKLGYIAPLEESVFESPYPESHLQHAADEVFFYGVNSSSEYLVVRLARGCDDEAEAWIYLKLKDGKIYQLKKCSGYQQSCSDKRAFTCGGLQIHYISPMRRWRIFYNGLLRETSDSDPTLDRMVHVKFAFQWHASSDEFDFSSHVNISALASALAKAKWNKPTPPLEKLYNTLDFYAQAGSFAGTVNIENDREEHFLYFFGERVRFLGDTSTSNGAEFSHILGQISKTGAIVHLAVASVENVAKSLSFGFIVPSHGGLLPITDRNIVFESLIDENTGNESVKTVFHAEEQSYEVICRLTGKQSHFESKKGWNGNVTIDCMSFQFNSLKGRGVLLKGNLIQSPGMCTSKATIEETSRDIPFVVPFSENVCQSTDATGGKGSSLGKLTQLSEELQTFIVPNGVVVTTSSYQAFLTKDVLKEIKNLEDILYGNKPGDVKDACQRVSTEVIKTEFPDHVLGAITKSLQKAFGENIHSQKFAVRSSATGEDTEQMSAAGQMDTFLGVVGLPEILAAVKKCWASQFGFIAAQYKRQNGQILNSPMAVVIQEMIPCDVAGVLFTCDPLTGSPTVMSITANYGLGESVVSGSEEPDTIELQRDEDDQLQIKDTIIGAKSHRIVVKDDEGTALQDVSESERGACCLSDQQALRLGNLAVKIETSYRSHRDIEWGFWNNNLYIFQSRPVTSGTGETDFEIIHEKDAPLRIENEYFTVCNVGEVMPGATSPLGLEVVQNFFVLAFKRCKDVPWQAFQPKYFPKGMMSMYYHVMFYTTDLFVNINEGRSAMEAGMIGMFGRILDDDLLFEIARERYGKRKKPPALKKYYTLIRALYIAKGRLNKGLKIYANYRVPVEKYKTSEDLYNALLKSCSDICEAMNCHMLCSSGSSLYNMVLMSILGKAEGELNDEVYRDFSHLLATISEVESADVPSAMQSLAFHIAKDIDPEKFKKMKLEEIEQWLKTSSSDAGVKFREFLDKHGHRCLKEFDIHSTTWGTNPHLLIKLLQNLVGNVSKDSGSKKTSDFNQIISDMRISLGFLDRLLLRFFLPKCRSAVQNREASKSLLIKSMDAWRKGYWYLARMMVSEGRIPDDDLLFFMTLEEVRELLSTRSPKIISRAVQRRRRFPELDRYIFPEIMKGFPKPINDDNTPIQPTGDDFMMKGVPVSQGVTKGFVRVALTLEEASHLKPGEILLTYSTDIGWSPYFPTLGGVVTELGGLISHGAVVSREYGLPCIAGLHGATRQFQTGDYVLLDGNKGILQKLPLPE